MQNSINIHDINIHVYEGVEYSSYRLGMVDIQLFYKNK